MYLATTNGYPSGFLHSQVKRCRFAVVAVRKKVDRFFSSLVCCGDNNPERLIKKWVMSSPKSVSLETLTHLLLPHTPTSLSNHAFSLYSYMTEMDWFEWNPKLAANLAALLCKQGRTSESDKLVTDSISRLTLSKSERGLSMFLCELLTSLANQSSVHGFEETYQLLSRLVLESNSAYVRRQSCKAMLKALCDMGRPSEAEALLARECSSGNASLFELRCLLEGYGRIGKFSDMERVFCRMEKTMKGQSYETVSFNMMLGCYGDHSLIEKMTTCLRRMKTLGAPLTIRTFNSLLNSCPSLIRLLGENGSQSPVSMNELEMELADNERALIGELHGLVSDLDGVMTWNEFEWKLDLHGMHLATAYVVILEWVKTMKSRLQCGETCPLQVTMVSGMGNHSDVRGESPIRRLAKGLIVRIGIPLKADRKNKGCFVAKGKVMEAWLQNS